MLSKTRSRLLGIIEVQQAEITRLNQQIVLMANKEPVVVTDPSPAYVGYVDDARVIEMEADGDAPT